jgi:hypothetical protein
MSVELIAKGTLKHGNMIYPISARRVIFLRVELKLIIDAS